MTSYEFEVAAKNAVIDVAKGLNIELTIEDLDLVWFAHELGNKKCTLYSKKLGNIYPEVTYDRDNKCMYVDIYMKIAKTTCEYEDLDFEAHV